MDATDIRDALGTPEILRLQQINEGLRVGTVFGRRVLVEPVDPLTAMDRVEASGLLAVPAHLKRQYKPTPSTGVVIKLGTGITDADGIREGAMVLFSKWAGMTFNLTEDETQGDRGKVYRMLEYGEIACTLEPTCGDLSKVLALTAEDTTPDVPVLAGQAVLR